MLEQELYVRMKLRELAETSLSAQARAASRGSLPRQRNCAQSGVFRRAVTFLAGIIPGVQDAAPCRETGS
jgi:hypothetical protein